MQQHDWIPERLFEPSVTLSQSALGSPGSDISMPPAINTLSSPTHTTLRPSQRDEVWKQNPSIRLFVHQYICLFIHPSIEYPFICLFVHLSSCSSIHRISIYISICSSIKYPSIECPSIHPSVRSSIYPFINHPSSEYPSIHLFIHLTLPLSVYLSIHLSFGLSRFFG